MKLFEKGINYWNLKYCCSYCGHNSKYPWGEGYDKDEINHHCLYFKPKRKIERDFKDRKWESGYGAALSEKAFPEWCPLEEIKDGIKT